MTTTVDRLAEQIRLVRESYELSLEPLKFPTLDEIKTAQNLMCEDLIVETLDKLQGTQSGTLPMQIWHEKNTHDRDLPKFVILTTIAKCWTPEETRDLLIHGWVMPEWPGQYSKDQWLAAFKSGGSEILTDYEKPFEPPESGTVTAYRSSFDSNRHGLSWTRDLKTARWFLSRGDMSGQGRTMRLWTVNIPHQKIIGHFTGRGEDEIVADVSGLKITKM